MWQVTLFSNLLQSTKMASSTSLTTVTHKRESCSVIFSSKQFSKLCYHCLAFNKLFGCMLFYFVLCAHISPTSQTHKLHTQSTYSFDSSSNLEDQWYKFPGFKEKDCFAVQASVIVRNGVNHPPEQLVKDISSIHGKLVDAMDLDVNTQLYEWNNPFPADKAGSVSEQGKQEQHKLGKQIAHKLLSLFGSEDIGDVNFLTSSKIAPKESSQSFYSGFFDGIHGSNVLDQEDEINEFDTDVDEKLLGFYNRCHSSKKGDSDEKKREFLKFLSSEHVEEIKSKITQILSIQEDILINEYIWQMYLMCGYEKANFDSSPWCSLFDEDDTEVLEYLGDLKLYHEVGYRTNKTWPQGCLLLHEIFSSMEEAIDEIEGLDINEESDGYTVGLFGFAEAETVLTFTSTLGLFNDSSPLTADNFETHKERNFRGGEIAPFSANVILLLYECAPEDFRKAETNYFVKLFVNGKATLIPGCPSLYCPFHQVTKLYQYLLNDCHSYRFCGTRLPRDEL